MKSKSTFAEKGARVFSYLGKLKKKIYKYTLKGFALFLAACAMGTVGFLSFSGIYALGAGIGLALAVMGLAVIYEFEINFQNINNTFFKILLNKNYVETTLAQQYFIKNFPIDDPSRPQFFSDYLQLTEDLKKYSDSSLTKEQMKKKKKELKATLQIFDELFAQSLFGLPVKRDAQGQWKNYVSKYQDELLKWLETHNEYKWQPDPVAESSSFNLGKSVQNALKWFRMKTIKSCGLLEVTQAPLHFQGTHALPLGGKDALLRYENRLFYVDQNKKTVTEITQSFKNEARFNYMLKQCNKAYRSANPQELSIIAQLSDRVLIKNKNKLKNYTQKQMKNLLVKRIIGDRIALLFSFMSGGAMALATLYLLSGSLAALSLTLPGGVIIALAATSGLAYVFTIYNTVSDMISNQTIQKWGKRALEQLRQGKLLMPLLAALLFGLGLMVTIFTAGTWWTLIKSAPAIYQWMGKLPLAVIGLMTTLLGLSALVFNVQNIAETLSVVMAKIINADLFSVKTVDKIKNWAEDRFKKEHFIQVINPFHWYLVTVIPTLEALFFIVHLASIGAMSDELRFKRLSEKFQKIFSFIQIGAGTTLEAGADGHYFLGDNHDGKDKWSAERQILNTRQHAHGHEHNHNDDLPSRCIKLFFSAGYSLYLAASLVDMFGSWFHKDPQCHLTFSEAWARQKGHPKAKQKPDYLPRPLSKEAEAEIAKVKIDKFESKHLSPIKFGKEIKGEKQAALRETKKALNQVSWSEKKTAGEVLQESNKKYAGVYEQCRLFKTTSETKSFMHKLIDKFPPAAPVA